MSAAAPQWPGRRTYAAGAAAAILFALYGSLVPFDWRAVSPVDALREVRRASGRGYGSTGWRAPT